MAQLIQGIVDTQKQSGVSLGNTNAGDNTTIELTIKSNGVLLEYDNPTFELLAKKSDNTKARQIKDITLEEGKIKIKCDIQLVLCEGLVTNQLYITDGDRISTVYFYFTVNPSLENEVLEESKDKIESLDKLDKLINTSFSDLEAYENKLLAFSAEMDSIVEVESKREANELIRSTSEVKRISNEDSRIISEEDRIANEAIRVENEEARGLAESERVTNENNRRLAENTRKTQENARVAAEEQRQSIFEENENIRKEQEGKRVQAESVRKNKFDTWEEREGIRLISEDQRREAEESRQLAESNRDKAEKVREQQEANRQSTYNRFNSGEEERVNNENTRKSNESSRIETENSRVAAEEERVAAENTRNSRYETAESNRNNTFNSNENKRQSDYESNEGTRNSTFEAEERKRKNSYQDAENTRNNSFNQQEENRQNEYTVAERLRVENENLRKNNEVTRGSNEETRKSNETSRVSSENIRVENENSRVAAEQKRQEDFKNIQSQYEHIVTENNNFKNEMNKDYGNAKVDYFGEEHLNIVNRLNYDFDNVHQRINDSSYLEYSGSTIKADNSYFGLTKDLTIKGRTLQNLFKARIGDVKVQEQQEGTTVSRDYINGFSKCIFGENQVNSATTIDFFTCYELKPSTTYYMNSYVKDYDVLDEFLVRDSVNQINLDCVVHANKNIITFTTTDKPTNRLTFYYFAHSRKFGKVNYGKPFYMPVQFLVSESLEFINTPFFENIKSVGENENNLISVKSCGKNLFDMNKYLETLSNNPEIVILKNGFVTSNGNAVKDTLKDFIKFKENTIYCIKYDKENTGNTFDLRMKVNYTDGSYQTFDNFKITSANKTIANLTYSWGTQTNRHQSKITNIIISESNGDVEFETYQESKIEYQLTEPLRSLANGVCDEIIGDELIRRVGKVFLDGTISINHIKELQLSMWTEKMASFHIDVSSAFGVVGYPNKWCKANIGICSKLPLNTSLTTSKENEGFSCVNSSPNYIGFNILKTKLETPNIYGFKQWLQQNPITVYYELAEPIITKIDKKAELKTFDEVTHFTSNNLLVPNLSVKVPSNVQAFIMTLKNENESLENELETTTLKLKEADNILKEMDTDLIKTNWEMDDRLFEVEWTLEDAGLVTPVSAFNINNKMRGSASVMALSKFEQAKIIIMSGDYDRVTLEGQLSKYLKRNIITQEEYDTLISMMDAKEIVVGE